MKRPLLTAFAALSLVGCTTTGVPPSPESAADRTVVDEQAATDVELAYKGMRLAIELGVDAGVIKGASASRAAELDNKAYQALQVARAAYRAGNSSNYLAALAEARTAIADALALAPAHQ
jgi:hypothetical protein